MYNKARSEKIQPCVITCQVCGSGTVKRTGRYGSFLSCSRYPQCRGTQPFTIDHEGQPCRHCGTPVVRKTHRTLPKSRPGGYYFSWWFRCPRCQANYLVEAAKQYFDATGTAEFSAVLRFSPDVQ
jgi:DNA topoisomerase-1